jgi:hypothetical protein
MPKTSTVHCGEIIQNVSTLSLFFRHAFHCLYPKFIIIWLCVCALTEPGGTGRDIVVGMRAGGHKEMSSIMADQYTVKKGYRHSRPHPRCHLPNYLWPGII